MPASRAVRSGHRRNRNLVQKLLLGWKFSAGVCCFLHFLICAVADAETTGLAPLGFDQIQFWTGSGTNRAAVVIQWNDSRTPSSLVWGYRWNNTATGFDMLRAITGCSAIHYPGSTTNHAVFAGADPRLMASWTQFDFGNALDSVVFQQGTDSRDQNDWKNGFWEYSLFGGQFSYDVLDENWNYVETATYNQAGSFFYSGVTWFTAPFGASDRILINGSWDAWSFAADFVSVPVATPESAPPLPPVAKSIRILPSSELEIVFQTTPSLAYQLESNTALQTLGWIPCGEAFTAIGVETVLTVAIRPQDPKGFYRLHLLP